MSKETDFYFPYGSKNSNGSTAALFEARSFYENSTLPYLLNKYLLGKPDIEDIFVDSTDPSTIKKNKIPLSNLYNENAFYGIIDHEGDIVAPYSDINNFSPVGKDKSGTSIYLQNFVADALGDMKKYLNDQILRRCRAATNVNFNELASNSPYYNLQVKKAYSRSNDINNLYASNAFVIASKFKQTVLGNKQVNSSIKNFNDFIRHYIPFVKTHLLVAPATKSRTMCFYNFKVLNTGLSFMFGDDDPGNDENKYEKYFLDIGFFSFAKACIRFGFRMDKNIPFLLHVDLASPAMQKYYQKYGFSKVEDVFRTRYVKLYQQDVFQLREFFVNSYNSFVKNNEYYEDVGGDICKQTSSVEYSKREILLNNQILTINKEPNLIFWTRLYIYYKILEVQPGFSQMQFESICKKANTYITSNLAQRGFSFINSFFNELNGVYFFDLLRENGVVQSDSVGYAARKQPDLVF